MITRTDVRVERPNWQAELANCITDPAELLKTLNLQAFELPQVLQAQMNFRLRVPRCFVQRMRSGDASDPLLLQILPLPQENDRQPSTFSNDPVDDLDASPIPGLVHKYRSRILLVTSAGCAVNCRYCFRRNYPYKDASLRRNQWQSTVDYLREHPEVNEVILSGGDPLTLPTARLKQLTAALESLPHIHTLRIHSRLPVVLPSRVDPELIEWLSQTRLRTIMVIHCNHAKELDVEVEQALDELRQNDVMLLNQSVLLKGVNDNVPTLTELSQRLFECRVQPYYLNLLDKAMGTAHFDLPLEQARELYRELAKSLPGYLLPKLVIDWQNKGAKTVLGTA